MVNVVCLRINFPVLGSTQALFSWQIEEHIGIKCRLMYLDLGSLFVLILADNKLVPLVFK